MASQIEKLLDTIRTLRAPGGCPWDQRQTLPDAARYLLDEAGELLEATLSGDIDHIQEELGDLLFMVCFCCKIFGETTRLDFEDIARTGNEKLIRRHPHVFGDRNAHDSAESQKHWNEIKAAEKRSRGIEVDRESILKDLPASAAPLHQSYRYGKDAASVGFDWPDTAGVWDKVQEEFRELRQAAEPARTTGGRNPETPPAQEDPTATEHELGDLLMAVANLGRHLGLQPEIALRKANRRFKNRFQFIEEHFGFDRKKLEAAPLADLELIWQEAKQRAAP